MEHFTFVLWLLLYPITSELNNLIRQKYNPKKFSDNVEGVTAIVNLSFYGYIAYLLY